MELSKNKVEIFLFILLGGYYVKFIGSLSISDIYVLLMIPFLKWKELFGKFQSIKTISFFYLLYFISQLFSELYVMNSFNNWSKGLMVTIISYFSFIFLFDRFRKNKTLIIIALFGLLIRQIIFINDDGLINLDNFNSLGFIKEDVFKFRVAPIFITINLLASYFLLKRNFRIGNTFILILVALLFFIFDTRSSGMILLLGGLISYKPKIWISTRKLLFPSIIFVFFLAYLGYRIWVGAVLNQQIGGNHSYTQVKQMENFKNPLELLLIGRPEFVIGWKAFLDKPLFGYGAWQIDKTGKFIKLSLGMNDSFTKEEKISRYNSSKKAGALVPAHSVILGAGVNNGIFAMLFMLIIIFQFIKFGGLTLFNSANSPYFTILFIELLGLIWSSLFSPLQHFRLSFPLIFAIILTLTINKNNRKEIFISNE